MFEQSVAKQTVRLDVEASYKCLLQARANGDSLVPGDDAHAVETRLVWACEHGLRTGVVSNVGGLRAWLTNRCSNNDAGKSESKTRPLEQQTGKRQSQSEIERKKRPREREKSEKRERENQQMANNVAFFFLFPTIKFVGHSLLACVCLSCVAVVVRGSIYRFQGEFVYGHGS